MSVYASLFKENNITGKRLLLLEEEDLKDMGIISKGHIIHLKVPQKGRLFRQQMSTERLLWSGSCVVLGAELMLTAPYFILLSISCCPLGPLLPPHNPHTKGLDFGSSRSHLDTPA